MQIWNSTALLAIIMLYFKKLKTDFMFLHVAVEVSSQQVDFFFLNYVIKKINDTNLLHIETIEL